MNTRIKEARLALGKSQAEVAERLNVTPNYVYLIESGKKVVTDRFKKDFCREYGVNAEWLITGEGDMFASQDLEQEITAFAASILNSGSDSFKARFIHAIAQLDMDGWKALQQIADSMIAENEKKEKTKKTE